MLALCLMLFATYYALNYAGIIGGGLSTAHILLGLPHGKPLFAQKTT